MPDFGDGSPRENYGAVDPLAPSVANGQITPEQWAEYQRQRRKAAILGTVATLGGMAFGQPAINALSGGGAAASASVPGAVGASAPPLGAGTVAGPTIAGGMGAGATAGAAGAAGAAAKGFMGLDPKTWATLIPALAGTVGSAMSPSPNFSPNTMTSDPNLSRLVQTMQGRLDKSEPLYDSIMAMANGLLPTQYQKGGGGMP